MEGAETAAVSVLRILFPIKTGEKPDEMKTLLSLRDHPLSGPIASITLLFSNDKEDSALAPITLSKRSLSPSPASVMASSILDVTIHSLSPVLPLCMAPSMRIDLYSPSVYK